jgi:hypothetical protein
MAVPEFRQLVASFLPQRPGFFRRSDHVGFVVHGEVLVPLPNFILPDSQFLSSVIWICIIDNGRPKYQGTQSHPTLKMKIILQQQRPSLLSTKKLFADKLKCIKQPLLNAFFTYYVIPPNNGQCPMRYSYNAALSIILKFGTSFFGVNFVFLVKFVWGTTNLYFRKQISPSLRN